MTHTERTPHDLRNGSQLRLHGFQIWVALPKELEDMEPEFHHIDVGDLPKWREGDLNFSLVAGAGYGYNIALPNHQDLFMIEVKSSKSAVLNTRDNLKGEIGICVVKGSIKACGTTIGQGNMLVSKIEDACDIELNSNTHLLLFGGKPFEEERYIYWNFVSSSKEKLEEAKKKWQTREFPLMSDDNSYIPIP